MVDRTGFIRGIEISNDNFMNIVINICDQFSLAHASERYVKFFNVCIFELLITIKIYILQELDIIKTRQNFVNIKNCDFNIFSCTLHLFGKQKAGFPFHCEYTSSEIQSCENKNIWFLPLINYNISFFKKLLDKALRLYRLKKPPVYVGNNEIKWFIDGVPQIYLNKVWYSFEIHTFKMKEILVR